MIPQEKSEIPDIDALDRENPLAVTEYVNDIFSYWFRVEVRIPLHTAVEIHSVAIIPNIQN